MKHMELVQLKQIIVKLYVKRSNIHKITISNPENLGIDEDTHAEQGAGKS